MNLSLFRRIVVFCGLIFFVQGCNLPVAVPAQPTTPVPETTELPRSTPTESPLPPTNTPVPPTDTPPPSLTPRPR